jgi:hypothetical protein
VTASARNLGVILLAAIVAGPSAAQQLPLYEFDAESMPAELPLRSAGDQGTLLTVPKSVDADAPAELPAAPQALDDFAQFNAGAHDLWSHAPAPIESTSTWLRRGFWYVEADAVVWNRHWNRDAMMFAADDPDVNSPLFFFNQTQLLTTNRLIMLDGAHPGEDTAVRVTLGHFLFRDQRNRDHTAEFSVVGGGDWEQHREVTSVNPNGLFVPFTIDGANRSFDLSSGQTLDYSSQIASFELNYRVKQRMRRDRLVMDPNGNWHRSATAGFYHDYLVGLRMMQMRDILDWRAEDIFEPGSDGIYVIRTDNDLFGFQLGGGIAYQASRWSIESLGKAGVYVNDALGLSRLDFTDEGDDADDFNRRMTEDELSAVLEARVIGRWHMMPNFSLRASLDIMYLSSIALAPNQANFIPVFATLNTTQDPFYMGASFGFEGFW